MVHCSVANHDPIDRYTIAFNTLPHGDINSGGRAHQPMAKMTAHGWKELGPLRLSKYAGSQGKEVHLFPVVLREYHCDVTHNTDKVIEFLKTYPAMQSNLPEGVITSRPDIHTIKDDVCPELDQLFGWFEQCLQEYRTTYKLYCDNLEITLAWSNHAPAGSGFGHPLHRHPMSYLSAVYYLTDGAPTFFDDPCTPRVTDTLDVWYHDKMESEWGINEKVDANQ